MRLDRRYTARLLIYLMAGILTLSGMGIGVAVMFIMGYIKVMAG